MRIGLAAVAVCACLVQAALPGFAQAQTVAGAQTAEEPGAKTTLRTTVRRVVLDVVVTGPKGAPAGGLSKDDFTVTEDGVPQRILSFDANGFSPEMDYVPPTLPAQPPNTFINLPATPEKGPLYVLLYDLMNMDDPSQMNSPDDHREQMIARQQMVKFIESKPEGARFAVFVRSDGLHLIQGFTSDKAQLYSAIDPKNPKLHMPKVFLMGANFGRGDRLSSVHTLHAIATYLEGLPGRKNLIWFSSAFPLSLFADDTDGPMFQEETKATLELLAQDQIALYPVDARGVPSQDSHTQIATSVHSDTVTSAAESGDGAGASGGGGGGSSPSQNSTFTQGSSAVVSSYQVMDEIARQTGGRAFYGSNDVAGELVAATQSGATYYTLTYAPTNKEYNGKLRNIHVEIAKKGYELAYRRAYYGTESPAGNAAAGAESTLASNEPEAAQRAPGDTLAANMEHGAPTAHQLVFVLQAHPQGVPAQGTPEQMAALATEPAYFKTRHRSAAPKPLAAIPLQPVDFTFDIPTRQFTDERLLNLELAVAVYDAEGRMMNADVRVAKKEIAEEPGKADEPRFFRVEQQLEVPLDAAFARFAVRDTSNDRTGAMEVKLPLAPENEPAVPTRQSR